MATRAAPILSRARHAAGLTQRELAGASGVAQSTIARIETGQSDPRVSTLATLLAACGRELDSEPAPGTGVDRTQIRELLRISPGERLRLLAADVRGLARFEALSGR